MVKSRNFVGEGVERIAREENLMGLEAAPENFVGQGALGADRRQHEGLLLAGAGLGEGLVGPSEQGTDLQTFVGGVVSHVSCVPLHPGEDGEGALSDRQQCLAVLLSASGAATDSPADGSALSRWCCCRRN